MSLTETRNFNNPNQGIPLALQYQRTYPRGFASSFKRWIVNPQTSFNVFNPTDTIRFILETSDYIDPYSSYLEIEVEFNPADYLVAGRTTIRHGANEFVYNDATSGCPIFMLDGPSTSLVDQLILYSNSREIERIQQYDQVGMLVNDLNIDIKSKWFKQFEGHQMRQPMNNDNSVINTQTQSYSGHGLNHQNQETEIDMTGPGLYNISYPNWNPKTGDLCAISNRYYLPGDGVRPFIGTHLLSQATGFSSFSRLYGPWQLGSCFVSHQMPPYTITQVITQTSSPYGYSDWFMNTQNQSWFFNLRRSYTTEFVQYDGSCGIQGTQTAVSGAYGTLNQEVDGKVLGNGVWNTDLRIDKKLEEDGDSFYQYIGANGNRTVNNNAGVNGPVGFMRPFSAGSALNQGIYFAPTLLKHTIYNGSFINTLEISKSSQTQLGFQPIRFNTQSANATRFHETRKTILVPILSGVLGTLIPKDQWKLLPGMGCGQLLFEWRFNPYAFFASGPNFDSYDFTAQFRQKGQFVPERDQWPIKYRFTKCQMVFDLWNFGQQVDQYLLQQNPDGIFLTSRMFTQGPTYAVPSASAATNSWQINNGISSLRSIYFYFLSNDYQKYNWCRKNFRCSRNITQVQLKIGQNYIPQNGPITGHAGQLYKNSVMQHDYIPFYMELQRAQTSIFASAQSYSDRDCPAVTPEQFVMDMRPYDPTHLPDIMFNQALFHELRGRGQALYTIDMLSDPFDETMLTGIDTKQFRPIELQIRSAGDIVSHPTSTTMYIFLYHDLIVRFSDQGIFTAGYG